jgi:hypothetical protein
MFHRRWVLLLIAAALCLPTFGTASAQPDSDHKKKIAERAAEFAYPTSKKLKEYNSAVIYQAVLATHDELPSVSEWYEKKLGGFVGGELLGVSVGGDFSRRSLFQDGAAAVPGLEKRPVSVRSYLVRQKQQTIEVIISRPPGEKLTVISITYIPEEAK